jgi:adenosylhomocysteine nucleosidase
MTYSILPKATPDILYVMAAAPEYGPALQARITPVMIGVGPIEATLNLARTLAKLEATDRLPALVVSLGSAGSHRLPQTGVFQVSAVSYRDMDASPFGFPKGITPYLDQPAVIPLFPRVPGLPQATLSTGANVMAGPDAYSMIGADMADMETFAVMRVCQTYGIPLIGLRGISDGDKKVEGLEDWTQYLHIIDEKLAEAVDRIEHAFALGQLV